MREARQSLFDDIPSTYHFGGLDNFYADYPFLKQRGMLPATFRDRRKAGKRIRNGVYDASQDEINEQGNVVYPAKLKSTNQIEAYSATVSFAYYMFVVHCLQIYGISSEIIYEVNQLTNKQRRIWTGLYFMGHGCGKKLVTHFYDSNWKLGYVDDIINRVPGSAMHDNYRRGIITAADAELIDRVLGPDWPPVTKRERDYNWDSIR